MGTLGTRIIGALAVCVALVAGACGALPAAAQEMKKQYWATSLARTVDDALLHGLDEAVARGEIGWLDVEPKYPIPRLRRGVNLILYHVGGNCYIGDDCDRFPDSEPTGDRWGGNERSLDLEDEDVREIVVDDLVGLVRKADKIAPAGAAVGVHLDNVHKLRADGLADLFNEYLAAVEKARQEGLISKDRKVGYVAKNNAAQFQRALNEKLIVTPPLYQIQENAELDQDGNLDFRARTAAETGRRCNIPVFLKTFGSDVAYTGPDGREVKVSRAMAEQMAQMPNVSGVAWSRDEGSYRPTFFAQGSPVRQVPPGAVNVCE
jgi:hypothetical protein